MPAGRGICDRSQEGKRFVAHMILEETQSQGFTLRLWALLNPYTSYTPEFTNMTMAGKSPFLVIGNTSSFMVEFSIDMLVFREGISERGPLSP